MAQIWDANGEILSLSAVVKTSLFEMCGRGLGTARRPSVRCLYSGTSLLLCVCLFLRPCPFVLLVCSSLLSVCLCPSVCVVCLSVCLPVCVVCVSMSVRSSCLCVCLSAVSVFAVSVRRPLSVRRLRFRPFACGVGGVLLTPPSFSSCILRTHASLPIYILNHTRVRVPNTSSSSPGPDRSVQELDCTVQELDCTVPATSSILNQQQMSCTSINKLAVPSVLSSASPIRLASRRAHHNFGLHGR